MAGWAPGCVRACRRGGGRGARRGCGCRAHVEGLSRWPRPPVPAASSCWPSRWQPRAPPPGQPRKPPPAPARRRLPTLAAPSERRRRLLAVQLNPTQNSPQANPLCVSSLPTACSRPCPAAPIESSPGLVVVISPPPEAVCLCCPALRSCPCTTPSVQRDAPHSDHLPDVDPPAPPAAPRSRHLFKHTPPALPCHGVHARRHACLPLPHDTPPS